MAGIYIHIPFCRKACHYCDFHFSTSTKGSETMATAIATELEMRRNELEGLGIDSLYFGGGTPSILSDSSILEIVKAATANYALSPELEFTIEANPDDLNVEKLTALRKLGCNRLSIGIQSFDDASLRWMNRAHTASESLTCVALAQSLGFRQISIDLIYGLPGLELDQWKSELQKAVSLDVQHISAYCLTVEPKTVLGHRVQEGTEKVVDEEIAARQFALMVETLAAAGFVQYEVSNFAKAGQYSRHNTAYWQGKPYLGAGPSAHSYIDGNRSCNVANNALYLKHIKNVELPCLLEDTGTYDRYNEAVMTGLRTMWGIDMKASNELHGIDFKKRFGSYVDELCSKGLAHIDGDQLILTQKGLFMADGIAANFFILEA